MTSSRRLRLPLLLVLGLGCALLPREPDGAAWPPREEVRLSVLALGDTGRRPRFGPYFNRQHTVARGLEAEHGRLPVDALLFLGDNFYWDGLEPGEVVTRVRQNLAAPYCAFLEPEAPRADEIGSACDLEPEQRHPVPIYAVLGNHDHNHPESPGLQRDVLPLFVPNWYVPGGPAQAIDLPGGLSLVLLDTTVMPGDPEAERAMVEALRASRGPWRVLATHHPLAWARDPQEDPYRARLLERIRSAGVDVQLVISGHEHNLQAIEMAPPGPALQIVSGSGSKVRELKTSNPALRFASAEPGFARLDLVGDGREQRLVVSLFGTRHRPPLPAGRPRLLARYALSLDGSVHDVLEPVAPPPTPLAVHPRALR